MVGLVGMSGLDGTHRTATGELALVHLDALPLKESLDLGIVALDDGCRREAEDTIHLVGRECLDELLHTPVNDGDYSAHGMSSLKNKYFCVKILLLKKMYYLCSDLTTYKYRCNVCTNQ